MVFLDFVMTYGSGGELLKLLSTHETFDMDVCRFYAGEILQALRHLHSLKIIHRDLKPENVLLNQHGHILLTDYGSAKILPASNPPEESSVKETTKAADAGEENPTGLFNRVVVVCCESYSMV
jgi:serine/threonine protein kinase